MSAYSATAPIYALYPGDKGTALSAERLLTGVASERFAIGKGPSDNVAPKISVELQFSADPGAFTLDVQQADQETAGAYINVPSGGTVTTVNATFFARIDLDPFLGGFIRLLQTLQTANVVTCTAIIRRS